jgi:hypothetical protein
MLKLIGILPLALMMACGDKDEEDSGSDTAVVEDSASDDASE